MAASETNCNTTLADHERLVKSLYEPGADVARINKVITDYQRSQSGWQFADQLLHSQDAQARFIGALTFTIKINTDWNTLSADDGTALLGVLLNWLLRLIDAHDRALVLRKLCSALVAYVLRPSAPWDRCLRHLLCCFAASRVLSPEEVPQCPSTNELLGGLSLLQCKTSLWFQATLVEEVGKTSFKSSQTHRLHDQVVRNLDDAIILLRPLLSDLKVEHEMVQEAIKCYQAWVFYAHRLSVLDAPNKDLESLKCLTPLVAQKLTIKDLFEDATKFFSQVLAHFPDFPGDDIYESLLSILTSEIAKEWMEELKGGEFGEEAQIFSDLLFAYGDAMVQNLARNIHQHQSQQLLLQLLELLAIHGYEGADLQICTQAIEFWQLFTEFATDSLFTAGEQQDAWMGTAKEYIAKALQHSWAKIRSPRPEIFASWDTETKGDFRTLRQDFTDLVQASFTLLGLSAFEYFAQVVLDSVASQSWYDLEAALFGLNALSDSVAENTASDNMLARIFRSRLFDDMMNETVAVPLQVQITALSTITDYTSFFERQTEFLPGMLSFLFTFLSHPNLANVAAKAISSTCSSCRKHLIPQLQGFLQAYEPHSQADPGVREKIVGAAAMIIQALPSDEEKMAPLSSLLAFVEKDVASCHQARVANQVEEAQASGLCALRSLSGIGKGLQMPDEAVIDLEAAESNQSGAWMLTQGQDLQARIQRTLFTVPNYLSFDNTIIEAGCSVLRLGYKETTSSLLGLSPNVTVEFVTWGCRSGLSYTGVAYMLETATAMLARRKPACTPAMTDAASQIWGLVLSLIQAHPNGPIIDPEVVACCINLAEKMIPHHLWAFFRPENISSFTIFLKLTIDSLITPEIMPKRAAASFWAAFVQKHVLPVENGQTIQTIMQQYGVQLAHALVRNISGEAARSELDPISVPLKKLVVTQPRVKTWLTLALESNDFVSDKVDSEGKRIWLQKILSLRGGAQTNAVVKDFWMACRGTNMDYAS